MVHNLIILGSGCAGSTAAIYSARAGLSPLILEGPEPGGQLTVTTEVENFPGFPEGITGADLVDLMRKQAERFGAKYLPQAATFADLSSNPFLIKAGDAEYRSRALIVATGASARYLGLESERRLLGRGVSICATCDGPFFRDVPVVVVGGGDSAFEEANFLTRFASRVYIVHRRDQLRASKIMVDRAKTNPKINFLLDMAVSDILDNGKNEVTGVLLKNMKTGVETAIDTNGVFIAIGRVPNTKIFEGQLELKNNYIVVRDGSRTNIKGVFAAGDVHDHIYRQAITAAGSGCQAALDAQHFLEE
ncbi:MAG: thioredoxin-disulfide reductase [Syntrophorhabdaceae bacterium]|nr:thioredoxin-disulfide reductase [Syntrophorhabdaceae bacterium]